MNTLADYMRTYGGVGRPTHVVTLPVGPAGVAGLPESPFIVIRCGDRTIVVNPMWTNSNGMSGDGGAVVSVDVSAWVGDEPHMARVVGFGDGSRAAHLPGRHGLTAVVVGEVES